MAETKYGKYIISNPLPIKPGGMAHHVAGKKRTAEGAIYLNSELLPETKIFSNIARTFGEPDPQPFIHPHKHDADEVIYFLSMTSDGTLGCDVEIAMGDEGEKHTFNRTTLVYIPKGLTHCPIYYRNFQKDRQFTLVSFLLQSEYY